VLGGPPARLEADPDQLEQLLINLVRNAADATLEAGGATGLVAVAWATEAGRVRVTVDDEGPGLASSANLFVPFYSTKPDGNGIGLALAPADRRGARRDGDAGEPRRRASRMPRGDHAPGAARGSGVNPGGGARRTRARR
jgi:hypothetical protein